MYYISLYILGEKRLFSFIFLGKKCTNYDVKCVISSKTEQNNAIFLLFLVSFFDR